MGILRVNVGPSSLQNYSIVLNSSSVYCWIFNAIEGFVVPQEYDMGPYLGSIPGLWMWSQVEEFVVLQCWTHIYNGKTVH